ncbi:MAG: phosphoribosylglycinamide formyltransferase [Chitinophagaceae bacterium]|nr:MAG: phosphoribosylglycinamide formyltransferase [Chitinophagaceae bacterium]
MKNIAVFASGTGSNAKKIIEHFKNSPVARVALIVCNKAGAGVINIAGENGVPVLMIEKEQFFHGDAYVPQLLEKQITFIVLAGFLWKIPSKLIESYPEKIINIHPALLPKYGGKGMYGNRVHEAVIEAGDAESGISIHFVNEVYDEGRIIFQVSCPVTKDDNPESLAAKIHALEHAHFPLIIEQLLSGGSETFFQQPKKELK